jgi:hypothetical protein
MQLFPTLLPPNIAKDFKDLELSDSNMLVAKRLMSFRGESEINTRPLIAK